MFSIQRSYFFILTVCVYLHALSVQKFTETKTASDKSESLWRRVLKLLLKIGITVLCFWFLSTKIDFSRTFDALQKAAWTYLLLAALLLLFSKLLSAWRLNIYFRNINVQFPEWRNIKLYWLGMFYNLFLPGAISGDAYKVVLLNRRYGAPYKKTAAAVLLDRFSGLLALGVILSVCGVIILHNNMWDALLIAGAIASVIGLYLIVRFFFNEFLPGFWPTAFLGLGVQLVQVICVYCLISALRLPLQHEWIFIFLIASAVSVLPVSLGGGLGTRELVFAEGARFFGLDPHLGVLISLLFYLCNVLVSAGGAYFIFHDPLKEDNGMGF